ncbi:MAG: O-antigen ligase family protein [Alicyclobacillus herbarius]|uniref:O-antigen ligase family protein n=1 Tax=Alicyclobacillus herbarius TaxID=122960 RepID=UPI00235517EE|nr:O-antigen ligase family protein [Alicyclobacillus herbarius]MCL6631803.1 O-antigen ligase family protein [Alicyclobacillus herbarius]
MRLHQTLDKVLPWFLLLQPVLDTLTTASRYTLHAPITFGILIRMFMFVFAVLFLLTGHNVPTRLRWLLRAYVGLAGGFALCNLLLNHGLKPVFSWQLELMYAAKAWYFPILLLTFFAFTFQVRPGFWPAIRKSLGIAASLTGAVILLGSLTGTALPSYHHPGKAGVSGWFFSANEVSAVLALTFPVVLTQALEAADRNERERTERRSLRLWLPVWLVCFGLLALGTKTAYLAGVATLFVVPLARLAAWLLAIRRQPLNPYGLPVRGKSGAWTYGATLMLYLGVTPWAPVAANVHAHVAWIHPLVHPGVTGSEPMPPGDDVEHLVYSSRDVYLAQAVQRFIQEPLLQKWLGAGYAGNFDVHPKLVEMDFHDAWFALGAIGFVIWILPLGVLLGVAIWRQVLAIRTLPANLPYWLSIALGLAVAGMAGHVLSAPAVSIYLAAILPYLIHRLGRTEVGQPGLERPAES